METDHFLIGNKGAHLYNGNIQCKLCKRQYKSEQTFLKHKCVHCITCHITFSSYQRRQSHQCSSAIHMCHFCKRTFKDEVHMSQHNCSFCSSCGVIFSSHQKLQAHRCTGTCPINRKYLLPSTPSGKLSIVKSVGSVGSYIGDEAIIEALNILRDHLQNRYVGYMTPIELQHAIDNPSEHRPSPCPIDQLSINIHHLRSINHWITSVYEPFTRTVKIYDSLRSPATVSQVMPQLQILYGITDNTQINYVPVTQQGTDPSCGAFAVAFAFSYALGIYPETQHFLEPYMREHLRKCLIKSEIQPFPAHDTNNRSQYMRLYKQCQRKLPSFCEKENCKKKSKSSSPTFQLQELKDKRNERKNPTFRLKELNEKRARRKSPTFRSKRAQ